MSLFRPAGLPPHFYDRVQWRPGILGLYESNYLRGTSPDGKRAFWIKHNLLAWRDPAREPLLELWCILHEKGKRPRVLSEKRPAKTLSIAEHEVRLQAQDVLLSPLRSTTAVRAGDCEAKWDLHIAPEGEPAGAPLVHFPSSALYRGGFPKKKVLTPVPRARFEGWLEFDGERIEVKDWIGIRNHNWGTEHAHTYAFGDCNLFSDRPDWIVDGFSARIRIGPIVVPPLSIVMLRTGADDQPFNGLGRALRAKARIDFPRWEVELAQEGAQLRLEMTGEPEEFAGLLYHHPDGKQSYCYNTKFARARASWTHGGTTENGESELAELEFLFPRPIPGIPIAGD